MTDDGTPNTACPVVSHKDLIKGLESVGLGAGNHIVVHSRLSSFGHVDGGADAVIDALEKVVTTKGTIVMPTFSGELIFFLESLALSTGINGSDGTGQGVAFSGSLDGLMQVLRKASDEAGIKFPFEDTRSLWERLRSEGKGILRANGWVVEMGGKPEVPQWIRLSRNAPPLAEEDVRPWRMPVWTGAIPEAFWHRPNTLRSHQYSGSFSACGRLSQHILKYHDNRPGQKIKDHPLYRMMESGGRILLLGVDHRSNSTIHVAQWVANGEGEDKVPGPKREFLYDFQLVDKPLDRCRGQRRGRIGRAEVRLTNTKALFEVVRMLHKEAV